MRETVGKEDRCGDKHFKNHFYPHLEDGWLYDLTLNPDRLYNDDTAAIYAKVA